MKGSEKVVCPVWSAHWGQTCHIQVCFELPLPILTYNVLLVITSTRNGHSKGIAFVEYEKEAEAAVALLKTDGTKLKGVELQVEAVPFLTNRWIRFPGGIEQPPQEGGKPASQRAPRTSQKPRWNQSGARP